MSDAVTVADVAAEIAAMHPEQFVKPTGGYFSAGTIGYRSNIRTLGSPASLRQRPPVARRNRWSSRRTTPPLAVHGNYRDRPARHIRPHPAGREQGMPRIA